MKFKVIDKNKDYLTGKEYWLCKTNLRTLVGFIDGRFADVDVNKFNTEWNEKKAEDKSDTKRGENVSIDNWEYERQFSEEKDLQIVFDTATENNFISLYFAEVEIYKGELKATPDSKFYLLDGFRRLLFDFHHFEKDYNKEVYVKIYDGNTTDRDIMKMMFHFNLWKQPQGLSTWMDRGWRLFLYQRLKIELLADVDWDDKTRFISHFSCLSTYMGGSRYGEEKYSKKLKLVTSERFYDDIMMIDEICKMPSLFREGENRRDKSNSYIRFFIENLKKVRLNGNIQEMKLADFLHFLKVEKNEVYRIDPMSVSGHYEKPIRVLIDRFYEVWLNKVELEKMCQVNPNDVELKDIPREMWLESLPDEIKEKMEIKSGRWGTDVEVNGDRFHYKNKKLYLNWTESKPRVYAIINNYVLYGYSKRFYLSKKMLHNFSGHFYNDREKMYAWSSKSKKEATEKIREIVNKQDWKMNVKETEFFWIEGLEIEHEKTKV